MKTTRADGLQQSVIACAVSKAEAARVKAARMTEHRAAGLTVINCLVANP